MLAVEGGWGLGLGMSSFDTQVPAFLASLGASHFEVGLMGTVAGLAGLVPRLVAGYVAARVRGMWAFVTGAHFVVGSGWVLFATLTWALAMEYLTVCTYKVLLFATLAVYFAGLELLVPIWQAFIAQVAGPERRGRVVGALQFVLLVSATTGAWLASILTRGESGPLVQAQLFAATALAVAAGNVAWFGVEEPAPAPRRPAEPLGPYLGRVYRLLVTAGPLRSFMTMVVLMRASLVLTVLWAAQAQRRLGLSASDVAILSAVAYAASGVAGLLTGLAADRVGSRAVLWTSQVVLLAGMGLMLGAEGWGAVVLVAALVGAFQGSHSTAQTTLLLAISPRGEEATYLALSGLVATASGALVPGLAGWASDRVGYAPVLAVASAGVLLAMLPVRVLATGQADASDPLEEAALS